TQNSNTTTATTAAHWDWKRHALAVPLRRLLGDFADELSLVEIIGYVIGLHIQCVAIFFIRIFGCREEM
ncbi:hypothetical protein D0B97_18570, partial [Vibrio cholerae]|nr:hypothetical protein [Vibrio cholerae]